ncbi:MAG: hypothetical protein AAFQ94_30615 [Bacteroidota bacterium]
MKSNSTFLRASVRSSLFLLLVMLLTQNSAFSQGCSSAGFCTMGVLKADQKFSSVRNLKLNYIEFNQLVAFSGLGEDIHATTIDAAFSMGDKNQLQVRIPYVFVNGPFANTRGVGDIYIAYSRNIIKKKEYSISAMLGTKIPRASTNLTTEAGNPLPLYYSPSLGTNDIVLGASFINKKWLLGIGYQQPLFNATTDNQFSPLAWEGTELAEQATRYDASTNYKRGADIMLRLERNFRFGRYNFFLGSMPVFRVTSDQITDEDGNTTTLDDARGLSLTGIVGGGYSINARMMIKVFYGNTLIRKDVNPDGLLKTSVITLTAKYNF